MEYRKEYKCYRYLFLLDKLSFYYDYSLLQGKGREQVPQMFNQRMRTQIQVGGRKLLEE